MPDTPERQSRTCAKCSANDSHAHHVQYLSLVHPVTGDPVDLSISKHIQCCAADGCGPCGTDVRHAAVNGVPADPSDEFTSYMQNKTDDHHQELWERHQIASPNFPAPVATPQEA